MPAEATWVGLLDSERWRRATRSRLASRVRASRAFASADLARRHATTTYRRLRRPNRFSSVETLCLFIGHVKSGGTLLGALLDAHPDALVSDELDVVRYHRAGFSPTQIFHLIEKGSRREALKGRVTARRLEPYSLAVPGLAQGRSDRVRLVGDTRAGPTTRQLGDDVGLVHDLVARLAPVEVRFVHVVRNPFDPIAAMVRRGRRTLTDAIEDHRQQCRRLEALRGELTADRLVTVRYEELVGEPAAGLERVCRFLGLATTDSYLEACATIVDPDRRPERATVRWEPRSIEAVRGTIESVPFLAGYQWD